MATKTVKPPKRGAGKSKYCEVLSSSIHNRGVFATRDIPVETKIIEYVGEKIDKDESDRRGWAQLAKAQETGDAAVYIFTLNDDWDIDGDYDWNTARLINHSCAPNCEAYIDDEEEEIWIWSLDEIKKGEELLFNYGFDLENYEDHPCRCGSPKCVGYIAGEDYWKELKKTLQEKARETLPQLEEKLDSPEGRAWLDFGSQEARELLDGNPEMFTVLEKKWKRWKISRQKNLVSILGKGSRQAERDLVVAMHNGSKNTDVKDLAWEALRELNGSGSS